MADERCPKCSNPEKRPHIGHLFDGRPIMKPCPVCGEEEPWFAQTSVAQPQQQPPPQQEQGLSGEAKIVQEWLNSDEDAGFVDRVKKAAIRELLHHQEQQVRQRAEYAEYLLRIAGPYVVPMGGDSGTGAHLISEIQRITDMPYDHVGIAGSRIAEQARADERALVVGMLDGMIERAKEARADPDPFMTLSPQQIDAAAAALLDLRQRPGGRDGE